MNEVGWMLKEHPTAQLEKFQLCGCNSIDHLHAIYCNANELSD